MNLSLICSKLKTIEISESLIFKLSKSTHDEYSQKSADFNILIKMSFEKFVFEFSYSINSILIFAIKSNKSF